MSFIHKNSGKIISLFLLVLFSAVMLFSSNNYTVANAITNEEFTPNASGYFSGLGTESSPYIIKTAADMRKLSELVNSKDYLDYYDKYYKLTDNIDMGGVYDDASHKWSGNSFLPIGAMKDGQQYFFSGVFDGNGKIISNLYIELTSWNFVGLFGKCQDATIKNVAINSGYITGTTYVGAIAGALMGSSIIDQCGSRIQIHSAGSQIGGIAGYVYGDDSGNISKITNCYYSGNIACEKANIVGGIAGANDGEIRSCYMIGTVNASSTHGAIVGLNYYNRNSGVIVKNTYYNKDNILLSPNPPYYAVGNSRYNEEDNKLSASKMVTFFNEDKPTGMSGLNENYWNFIKPINATTTELYYPLPKGIGDTNPIMVIVLPSIYKVTFNLNGAEGDVPPMEEVRHGEYATAPDNPVRKGYTFLGWSTDRYNRDGIFNFKTTKINDDTILYAIWDLKVPEITINVKISNKTGYEDINNPIETGYGNTVSLIIDAVYGKTEIYYMWYKNDRKVQNHDASNPVLKINEVTDSGLYYCKVIVNDGNQEKSAQSLSVNITISQAIDPSYQLPEFEPVKYYEGIKLSDFKLPEKYSWINPNQALTAKNPEGTKCRFRYIPSDTENFKTIIADTVIVILKADYSEITHDVINVVYSFNLKLKDIKLNNYYHWVDNERMINAGDNQSFDAIYNKESDNYNDFSLTIVVSVAKADSTVNPFCSNNIYANMIGKLDGYILDLSDNDTMGVCKIVLNGMVPKIGETNTFTWKFVPHDKINFNDAEGTIDIFIYSVELVEIRVKKNPDKMSYIAYEQLDPIGMEIVKVFNNGEEIVLTDYTIEYLDNPNNDPYFLFNNDSLNMENETIKRRIRIIYPEAIDDSDIFNPIIENFEVTKAQYNSEEISHKPIDLIYYDLITLRDIIKELEDGFTLITPEEHELHADYGQIFKAQFNDDPKNYKYLLVDIIVNIKKGTYDNSNGRIKHDAIECTYFEGLTLKNIDLKEDYYWEEPNLMLNATDGLYKEYNAYYNPEPVNYENYPLIIKLLVNKAEYILEGVELLDAEFVYDGQPHSLNLSGNLPSGVTVEYSGNGGVRAGEYIVTATFIMIAPQNYEPIKPMNAKYIITKKSVTLDFNPDFDGKFTYNQGENIDFSIIPNGLIEGDELEVEIKIIDENQNIVATGIDAISQVFDPGYYTLTAEIKNYNISDYSAPVFVKEFVVMASSVESQAIAGQQAQVVIVSDNLYPDYQLIVNAVDTSSIVNTINKNLNKTIGSYELKQMYDISLKSEKNPQMLIELDGIVQMKIRIPDELLNSDKDLKIVYVDSDNNVTELKTERIDNYLVFNVSHLSNYAIVSESDIIIDDNNDSDDNKPDNPVVILEGKSVWLAMSIIAVVCIGSTIIVWAIIKKKF